MNQYTKSVSLIKHDKKKSMNVKVDWSVWVMQTVFIKVWLIAATIAFPNVQSLSEFSITGAAATFPTRFHQKFNLHVANINCVIQRQFQRVCFALISCVITIDFATNWFDSWTYNCTAFQDDALSNKLCAMSKLMSNNDRMCVLLIIFNNEIPFCQLHWWLIHSK